MKLKEIKRILIIFFPYMLIGLLATKTSEAWRISVGKDVYERVNSFFKMLRYVYSSPMPSFHPFDFSIGIACGILSKILVSVRGMNAKKYRHNVEYGSACWGGAKDIAKFMDPTFEKNIILTKTERIMLGNRPKNPDYARNKNVLIVGGSGSGKTRFWIKPNLLQLHSSYVLTDPKGTTLPEVGNAFVKANYRIKIFNTINFKKACIIIRSLISMARRIF